MKTTRARTGKPSAPWDALGFAGHFMLKRPLFNRWFQNPNGQNWKTMTPWGSNGFAGASRLKATIFHPLFAAMGQLLRTLA